MYFLWENVEIQTFAGHGHLPRLQHTSALWSQYSCPFLQFSSWDRSLIPNVTNCRSCGSWMCQLIPETQLIHTESCVHFSYLSLFHINLILLRSWRIEMKSLLLQASGLTFQLGVQVQWRNYIAKFWMRAPWPILFHFDAVSMKIWPNNRLVPPLWGWYPFEKSWICHWWGHHLNKDGSTIIQYGGGGILSTSMCSNSRLST